MASALISASASSLGLGRRPPAGRGGGAPRRPGTAIVRAASPPGTKDAKDTASRRPHHGASAGTLSSAIGEEGISILEEKEGFGQLQAAKNDLLLVHYVGRVKDSGVVFDSTRGDQTYLDGGPGVFRPTIIQIAGAPVPGICNGLRKGLEGVRVGTVRTFDVPPTLGFGAQAVAGPYAVVPANSTLTYEIEVLRLSRDGPDALMKSISKCGQGGAGAQETGCAEIVPKE